MIIGPIVLERELYNDIVYSIASYFWNILQQEGHLDLAHIQIEPTDTESRFVLGTKSNDGDIINEADIFFTNLDEFTRVINERCLTLCLIKELRYRYTAGAHKELQQKHHELCRMHEDLRGKHRALIKQHKVLHEDLRRKYRALKKQHKEFQDSNGFNQKIDNIYNHANKLMNCIAKLKKEARNETRNEKD